MLQLVPFALGVYWPGCIADWTRDIFRIVTMHSKPNHRPRETRSRLLSATILFVCGGVTVCGTTSAFAASPEATSAADTKLSSEVSERGHRVIPDLKLELNWIPPGSFVMGSPAELAKNKAETPQFQVTITQGFWLGRTEVTQAQYEAVIKENPSTFKDGGPDAPVERVSWIDAMAFCEKLNEREASAGRLPDGFRYTLPTEAQWEYACRAGTTDEYPGDPAIMAWYDGNSGGKTHTVATKQPNAWGLYDMSGNVLEWCLDWYGEYPRGPAIDPAGPRTGYYRMARGGSCRAEMHVGRSASRAGGSPGRLDYTIGFRVALCAVTSPRRTN